MALNFPNSPTIGQIYTDATSGFSYEWDGTVWKSYSQASASNIKILDDVSGSFNGSTQLFALTSGGVSLTPASSQSLIVVLGGVVQEPGEDYTIVGSNIFFTTAPDTGLTFSGVSLGPAVPITYANDGVIYIRNTYVGSGTTGPFSFPEGYTVGYLDVYRNGVRLSSGTDFVGTSGTNFFLTDAAASGDELEAVGYTVAAFVQANSNLDNLNVIGITTTGRLQVTTNANITGIVTASGGFVGNLTGTATTATNLSDAANIATGTIAAARLSGSYTITINGTATGLSGTPNITVGFSTATEYDITGSTNSLSAGGLNVGVATLTTLNGTSGIISIGSTIRTRGYVETQSSATVATKILSLDASQGTVFTHTTTDNIGIVSFSGIRTDSAGAQTFTVIVTQGATPYNTTAAAGIGTLRATVRTTPDNVGYTTHIRVGGGTSTVLTNAAGAMDLLTFIVSYDGTTPSNSAFKIVGFAATDFRNAIV